MKPEFPPKIASTDEGVDPELTTALRFWDSPGLPELHQFPLIRCKTCDGVGEMSGATCPDCNGCGGAPAHATNLALHLLTLVHGMARGDAIRSHVQRIMSEGSPASDLLEIEMGPYLQAHGRCYFHALALALRFLVFEWVSEDAREPAISALSRFVAGDWSEVPHG